MNFKKACLNLGLNDSKTHTIDEIKRAYRRLALIYHPDKNKETDAVERFHEIQESYEYMMTFYGNEDSDHSDGGEESQSNIRTYTNILFSYLKPILGSTNFRDIKERIFYTIVEKIAAKCETKAIEILENLDKKLFLNIVELLKANKEVFHLNNEFLAKLEEAYLRKTQNDECIILSPFLDDLFDSNLYKLIEGDKTYLIPLWHHELVYDNNGADLYIQCIPILPDNVEIDEKNNIHVKLSLFIEDIWDKETIEVKLGNNVFNVRRNQLKMTAKQTVLLANCGISRVNTDEIYNITKKSDIYVHIELA
jgi:hypothetical protein